MCARCAAVISLMVYYFDTAHSTGKKTVPQIREKSKRILSFEVKVYGVLALSICLDRAFFLLFLSLKFSRSNFKVAYRHFACVSSIR